MYVLPDTVPFPQQRLEVLHEGGCGEVLGHGGGRRGRGQTALQDAGGVVTEVLLEDGRQTWKTYSSQQVFNVIQNSFHLI